MNDNYRIAINSILIFVRLIVTSLVSIFTSRIVLDALGASDYGLYNVVGGIVTLLAIVNTSMLSTTYRYIAFEVGKKDKGNSNRVFNISLQIHLCFSLFIVLLGLTLGDWYANNYLNVSPERLSDAIFVLRVSILTTAVSTILVPYQGLVVAYEKFLVISILDILFHVLKIIVIIIFIESVTNRLCLYSIIMMFYTISYCISYVIYCYIKYSSIIKLHFYKDISLVKEMISFAFWTLFGALANIGRSQGSVILINYFFGTIVNAAYAVGTQVEGFVMMFARCLDNAAVPQITKKFSSGEHAHSVKLTCYISKYTFLLMLVVAFPTILEMDFLLNIWLKTVPEGAATFCCLMILGNLIGCLGEGIPALVNATGKIKTYQIVMHSFTLLVLPVGYYFMKLGYDQYTISVVYCIICFLGAFLRLYLLKKLYKIDIREFFYVSYSRMAIVSIPLIVFYIYYPMASSFSGHFIGIMVSEVFLLLTIAILGTNKIERKIIKTYLFNKIRVCANN